MRKAKDVPFFPFFFFWIIIVYFSKINLLSNFYIYYALFHGIKASILLKFLLSYYRFNIKKILLSLFFAFHTRNTRLWYFSQLISVPSFFAIFTLENTIKECISIQEFLSYRVAYNNYNYKTEHVYFMSIKRIAFKRTEIFKKIIMQRNRSKQNYIQF